jgi:hypothetical protein
MAFSSRDVSHGRTWGTAEGKRQRLYRSREQTDFDPGVQISGRAAGPSRFVSLGREVF